MIQQLNVDFTLLNRFFGIPASKIPEYRNKSLEEILKIEAEQGNQKAQEYKRILSDPEKLYEIFKLTNVENKFIILQNLSEQDLDGLLPFLNSEQLSMGLQFFTDEKLIQMSKELPTEELLGMMFEEFTMEDILSFMDDDTMNTFLRQPQVDRDYSTKYFKSLDQKSLEQIMVQVCGENQLNKSKEEYIEYLTNLDDQDYQHFLYSMEKKFKIGMISDMVSQDIDLALLFENNDIIKPFTMLMQNDKIKMMQKLDPEFLIPMIQELPLDLTQIVLTQIDPREFSEILARDFQNVLESVVLFAG